MSTPNAPRDREDPTYHPVVVADQSAQAARQPGDKQGLHGENASIAKPPYTPEGTKRATSAPAEGLKNLPAKIA